MIKKFVPDDFIVPGKLETEEFRLRMLTPGDVGKDYKAVMSSREHLRSLVSKEDKNNTWPEENMTIEEDLEDLKRHQEEFLQRKAFAYTVMNLDESRCLGCVYIDPSEKPDIEAEVTLWAVTCELENGLETRLLKTVKRWIEEKWPFNETEYPLNKDA